MSSEIDIKKLTRTTRKALAKQKAHEEERIKIASAKKKSDEEKLFQTITSSLAEKINAAAAEGKHSIEVWEMGDFGYRNSDEIPEDTPIDWSFMNKLEKFCQDNHLTTSVDKRNNEDIGSNFFSKDHIYYVLVASWPT